MSRHPYYIGSVHCHSFVFGNVNVCGHLSVDCTHWGRIYGAGLRLVETKPIDGTTATGGWVNALCWWLQGAGWTFVSWSRWFSLSGLQLIFYFCFLLLHIRAVLETVGVCLDFFQDAEISMGTAVRWAEIHQIRLYWSIILVQIDCRWIMLSLQQQKNDFWLFLLPLRRII